MSKNSIKTFAVLPFFPGLRRWVKANHPKLFKKAFTVGKDGKEEKRDSSNKKKRDSSNKRGNKTPTPCPTPMPTDDGGVFDDYAFGGDDEHGWTAEDMFKANEKFSGKKIQYTGNPHEFGEHKVVKDPHAFHVVGGAFMNSNSNSNNNSNSNSNSRSERSEATIMKAGGNVNPPKIGDEDAELTPFFGDDGTSAWDDKKDVVEAEEDEEKEEEEEEEEEEKEEEEEEKAVEAINANKRREGEKQLLNMLKSGSDTTPTTPTTPTILSKEKKFPKPKEKEKEKEKPLEVSVRESLLDFKQMVAALARKLNVKEPPKKPTNFIRRAMQKLNSRDELKR